MHDYAFKDSPLEIHRSVYDIRRNLSNLRRKAAADRLLHRGSTLHYVWLGRLVVFLAVVLNLYSQTPIYWFPRNGQSLSIGATALCTSSTCDSGSSVSPVPQMLTTIGAGTVNNLPHSTIGSLTEYLTCKPSATSCPTGTGGSLNSSATSMCNEYTTLSGRTCGTHNAGWNGSSFSGLNLGGQGNFEAEFGIPTTSCSGCNITAAYGAAGAKTAYGSTGSFLVPATYFNQGETDAGANAGTYAADLVIYQANVSSALNSTIGQTGLAPLFVWQKSTWPTNTSGILAATPRSSGAINTCSTSPGPSTDKGADGFCDGAFIGISDAAINHYADGKIFVIGPQYFTPFGTDGKHKTAAAYRREGCYEGKYLDAITHLGQAPRPFYPRTISVSGSTVTVRMWVPFGTGIAFDTTNVAPLADGNMGFEWTDTGSSGTTLVASSATITGSDTLTLTLSGTPSSTGELRYAWTAPNGACPGTCAQGTSTTSLTVGTGTQTLTVSSSSLGYTSGVPIEIYQTSVPTTFMIGTVTSYSGTTLVVNVTSTGGSGTHTDWTTTTGPFYSGPTYGPRGNLMDNDSRTCWSGDVMNDYALSFRIGGISVATPYSSASLLGTAPDLSTIPGVGTTVPVISSFTAACSSTSTPGTSVTCPAGNNDVLAWSVSGATSLSINQGVGSVTPLVNGSVVVQPFNVSSLTYILTATNSLGSVTSTVTITLDDDYARVALWPSVVRAFGFDGAVACVPNYVGADPVYSPGSLNGGGDGLCTTGALDTGKAVSGAGSFRMLNPGIAGIEPTGNMTINFSANGSQTFGAGQEFYLQWRQYMDSAYVQNVYLAGVNCKPNLTLTGVTGTFAIGETVTSNTSVQARGTVAWWDASTGTLILDVSTGARGNQVRWFAGSVVTGGTSGATATVAANNGGGTGPGACPGPANGYGATSSTSLTIGTGTKTLLIQTDLAYVSGTAVIITSRANSANRMVGTVASYAGAALVVSVTSTGGSGTFSDWAVEPNGYQGTSSTSITPVVGSTTFTTQAGLAYTGGELVFVQSSAAPTAYMKGTVTSYSGSTLVINVTASAGSGAHADWNLNLQAIQGTSASSVAVGTGSKTFTVNAGLTMPSGTFVMLSSQSAPTKFMVGSVSSYAFTTGVLVISVSSIYGGSGTGSDWNLNVYGDSYGTGMKQIMLDPADTVVPATTSSQLAPNCIGGHLVMAYNQQQQYGEMYMGCAQIGGEGQYEGFTPHYFAGTSPQSLLQSGNGCNYAANTVAGVPGVAPCVLFDQNAWMTMQLHVKIGTWYPLAQPGYPTATATFTSGAGLTGITITGPGYNWAPGTTIVLDDSIGAWTLFLQANGLTSSSGASASCPVDNLGQIASCTITAAGNVGTHSGTATIRWPAHSGPNYRRDSIVERWQASPGQPSVLVETMPYYDIVNNAPQPNDWAQSSSLLQNSWHSVPGNYGKAWFTGYMTGRDANAGPWPDAHTWVDNFLVSTNRLPDPGVAVQPPTNLAIAKASYPSITLSWERNANSSSAFSETGYDVERCPNQMYNCMAGSSLVSGAVWTTVASNIALSTRTYTETVPDITKVYTYRVRAVGTANNSDWSNPTTTAIHPPTDLVASWVSGGVQLSWTQRDDIGLFSVERCTGVFQYRRINGFIGTTYDAPACFSIGSNSPTSLPNPTIPFTQITSGVAGSSLGSTITYTDTTAVPGTLYSYRVRSYNSAGSWLNWNANNGGYSAYTSNVVAGNSGGILTASPNPLNYSGVSGGSNPVNQTVTIGEIGGTLDNWTASKTQSWLTISPTSGTAAGSFTASVNITGLGAGSYSDTITISSTTIGVTNSPITVPVSLTVTAAGTLTVSPSSMSFSCIFGGSDPPTQGLFVSANVTFSWTASKTQSWLTISPTSGSANGTVTVAPSCAGLSVGTYNDTITVSSGSVGNSPQTSAITLSVTAGPPTIVTGSPLPSGIWKTPYSTTLVGTGGTPPYTWSVTSGSLPSGLTLASSTGVVSGSPTLGGNSSFFLSVTDSLSQTSGPVPFNMSIVSPPPTELIGGKSSVGGGGH